MTSLFVISIVPIFAPAGAVGVNRMVKVVELPLEPTLPAGCVVQEKLLPKTVMGVVIVKLAVEPGALVMVNTASAKLPMFTLPKLYIPSSAIGVPPWVISISCALVATLMNKSARIKYRCFIENNL